MSASLIGRWGSSAFRLSTTAVSMSLTGSRFSSESAPGPFQHGIRRRGGTIFWRPCRQTNGGVQADMRTHLIHRPARDTICDCCMKAPPTMGALTAPTSWHSRAAWRSRPQHQKPMQAALIARPRIWREVLKFVRLPLPLLPVGRGRFFDLNIWPDFRKFRIQRQPLLKPRFAISLDGIDGAFRFANATVDAFVRMDDEHVLALVEAVHGAHLDAVHSFAANAAIVDDVCQLGVLSRQMEPLDWRICQTSSNAPTGTRAVSGSHAPYSLSALINASVAAPLR